MGKLIDGEWIVKSIITTDDSGAYDRLPRTFLDTIEDGHPIFQPELGRYHLYVSSVSYTHLRAHETLMNLVCRLLLE